jgi:hypothetical protein
MKQYDPQRDGMASYYAAIAAKKKRGDTHYPQRKEGQVDLFTRRVRKPPPPSEFAEQVVVARLLKRWAEPDCWWSHIGHGERRDPVTAARLSALGVRPGVADFLLLTPRGVYWLELKRQGSSGRLSPEQKDFQHAAQWAGSTYQVAHGAAEAVDILKDWGCLQKKVRVQ